MLMHDASKRTVHMDARNSAGSGEKNPKLRISRIHTYNPATLANGDSLISK